MDTPNLPALVAAPDLRSTSTRPGALARGAVLLLAGTLLGQSPLTTAYSGLGVGLPNSQIAFDLTVIPATGITIKSLDVNLSSPVGTVGTITVWSNVPPGSYTAPPLAMATPWLWAAPSVGTVVAEGVGKPTHVCLTPPIFLPLGVHGLMVQYTAVAPQYTVNLPLPPAPWPTAATAEVTFSRGDYAPAFWVLPLPGPNTFDGAIHYDLGATVPCLTCASKVSAGAGCASPCAPFPVLKLDASFPVTGEVTEFVTSNASPCAFVGITAFGIATTCGVAGCPICFPSCLCMAHVQLDVTTVGLPVAGQWVTQLTIPPGVALCGATFFAQSFTLEAPPAIVSSNYLTLMVGS